MNDQLLTLAAQFGAAGLIAWMWLTERRHNAKRDRQLDEAHRCVSEQRVQLDQLLSVIAENTRAITSLERSQRRLSRAIERLASTRDRPEARARADADDRDAA